ncbi:MAG: ATPase [Flavobacteriaceae bacterium]|jgi:N-acetylglucosamine kinase-like BadF-type ATPase|nr:ATPase [Flavobacteriaceae bacterium]
MIAIVDGGSTKCDWIIIKPDGKEILRTESPGFHPRFVTSEDVEAELIKKPELQALAPQIEHLFFYGAGCSSESVNKVLVKAFGSLYPNAVINVDHDLKGAAYSAYFGKPAIVCILGTGSNACYFNGDTIKEEIPSLGWILGDEGSGSHMGKKLVHAYFSDKMPGYLSIAFKDKYNLSIDELLENVYQKPKANSYIAGFNRFIAEHKREPFIQNLIYESMKAFFENQVMVFPEARESEINFIGSIAHYYEDILKTVASEYHLTLGNIVKKPIDNLVKYHLIYKIPTILKKP